MSAETSQSDILDRNGLIISPPLLKMHSIRELDEVSVKNLLEDALECGTHVKQGCRLA